MKANFLTSPRGPSGRKKEPLTYDNHCDDDPWIIKQRSTEPCETKCFKWQQLLNNSGSFSKMTFRGCYDTMFDMRNPSTHAIPDHNFCTAGEVQLTCLADASIIEHSCWCEASDIYPQYGRRSVENLSQAGLSDEDIEVERDQLKSTQSAGEVLCEKLKASKQIKRISIMRPQMWSQAPTITLLEGGAWYLAVLCCPDALDEDPGALVANNKSFFRLVKIVAKTPELTHCSGSYDSSEVTCGDDDNTQLGVPSLSIAPTTESQSCLKNVTSKAREKKEEKKNKEGKTEAKSKVEAVLNKGVKASDSSKAKEAKEGETARASDPLEVKEPEKVKSTEEVKKGTKVEAFFDGGGAEVAISLLASLDGQKLQVVGK
ncbi:unnamed protein product [Nippostrongylus brasiliensis]|uniref:CW domain-containing protein n=1 Tax=Nippostrongylus brasiliensis TaxID=27835 RepID=A0A0N4YNM7_NIPBR|nr:unnamed protein product [Nippostrongylus brasiliensis]